MKKVNFQLTALVLVFAVLLGACAGNQTADPEATAASTRTPEPEATEHQTVMPPTPTETAVPAGETSTPEPAGSDAEPVIEVNKLEAAVGGAVEIHGMDFPEETRVDIGIGRVNSEYDLVDAAETDAEGELDTTFTIPEFVEPEDRWVIVVTAEEGRIKVFSEELNIIG
jgi:hypothetical protein